MPNIDTYADISVPSLSDKLLGVDDPGGTPLTRLYSLTRVLGLLPGTCDGRLTTESGVPVSTSDRTAQSTLYFTPFRSATVSLYDGTRWRFYSFSEVSLTLTGLTSGKNYDVFLYDNSGTLTMELSDAWTNDTTRANALTTLNGVYLKSAATTRRYLGTIRTTGTTTTEDSAAKRLVWDANHFVSRPLRVTDTTNSWTYASASWNYARSQSSNRVETLVGLTGYGTLVSLHAQISIQQTNTSDTGFCGIGYDASNAVATQALNGFARGLDSTGDNYLAVSQLHDHPTIGWHFYAWLQRNSSTNNVTYFGDNGYTENMSGMAGMIYG